MLSQPSKSAHWIKEAMTRSDDKLFALGLVLLSASIGAIFEGVVWGWAGVILWLWAGSLLWLWRFLDGTEHLRAKIRGDH